MISGSNGRWPRALVALALVMALGRQTAPALAQMATSPDGWDLPRLMTRLAAVKTSSAHFVERKYLHMLKEPLEEDGTLRYRAPDQLQKDTLQPQPEHLRVDHDTLTIEREGKSQILKFDEYPQVWAIIESIRATLAGDLPALERFYALRLDGSETDWQLLLQPRDRKMQEMVQVIRISGSGGAIKRIETLEGDGDRSDMTITEDAR